MKGALVELHASSSFLNLVLFDPTPVFSLLALFSAAPRGT
jgi:hypothetical protein